MAMFSHEFMIRALISSAFIAVIAPMLGVFLVLRRQSLMADTLSHVSLAGIALGFFIDQNPTVMTIIVVAIASILLEYLRNMYRSYSEVSTAILMAGGLSLALMLMNFNQGTNPMNIQQYLFGSIVTITWQQVQLLGVMMVVIVVLFTVLKRPMYVLTFDEETAHVDGLPIRLLSMLFSVVTGIVIAMMIPISGALLISAIMVLPGATAMKLGKSFRSVILISIVIGMIGMISGLVVSYQVDSPPGATITLIFIGLFILLQVILLAKKKIGRYSNRS